MPLRAGSRRAQAALGPGLGTPNDNENGSVIHLQVKFVLEHVGLAEILVLAGFTPDLR